MEKKVQKIKFKNIGKFFSIFFCGVIVCLTFTLADFFSSLITVGGFTFTSSDITISKYSLYAVSTATSTTNSASAQYAETCKNQGGAGYIYISNAKFYIIASIYENLTDAKKVVSNLSENKINSEIINIEIPSISLNSNLSTQEKTTLENSINIFKNTYKKLYDIAISLDTGIITDVNARLNINGLASEIKTASDNFTTIFNSDSSTTFLNIKIKLSELCSIMNNLVNPNTNTPFTSQIKETYCNAIFLLKDLSESINWYLHYTTKKPMR